MSQLIRKVVTMPVALVLVLSVYLIGFVPVTALAATLPQGQKVYSVDGQMGIADQNGGWNTALGNGYYPSLSPSGNEVAYSVKGVANTAPGAVGLDCSLAGLYIMNVDGTNNHRVMSGGGTDGCAIANSIDWSSDGLQLLFTSDADPSGIVSDVRSAYIMTVANGTTRYIGSAQ